MRKVLLSVFALATAISAKAQVPEIEVLEEHSTLYAPVTHENENLANKMGDKMEFDVYYRRSTGMQVDSIVLQVAQFKVPLKATSTDYTGLFWNEIGNWYPFRGEARVLGVYVAYAKYTKHETNDIYDVNIYHASTPDLNIPDEILVSRQFYGYEIHTGDQRDSFTYIQFKSSDYTNVKNGFMLSVALREVSGTHRDSLDEVKVYSSMKGDGRGEHRAMVKLTNQSFLYQGQEYVPLDRAIPLSGGGYYEFDFDIMIIPILDVTSGVGYVDMKGVVFNGHYPNPAQDHITLDLNVSETQNNFTVTIQTMSGQTIKTINPGYLSEGNQLVNVDVSDLAAGSYIYTINTDKSSISSMLMISK
ncbi:T9SS type A sorting domain-containing protein [bacterium]|nr:T9SS type A sorting domain-containing protein [bacterium]